MLCHDSLANYYKINFILMQNYNYNLTELDNMIRFERELYLVMLEQHVKDQNDVLKQQG